MVEKLISEVLGTLLMVVLVVGLIGVVSFFLFGLVGRGTAGVIKVSTTYCVPENRLEILATNEGTTSISSSDMKIFIAGTLISSRFVNVTTEDKNQSISLIDPGAAFWILINNTGTGAPKAGKTYRGQIVYAGKAVDFIVGC